MMDVEVLFGERRFTLGEGPVWDAHEEVLYLTDIRGYCYLRYTPATGDLLEVPVPGMVGAVALREACGLLLATSDGLGFHEPDQSPPFEAFAHPESGKGSRFNDGAADAAGRYWVGSFGRKSNTLYRVDRDLTVTPVESGFGGPNGIAWSLDGRTMYFTDSPAKTIYRYRFDQSSGMIDDRQVFWRSEGPGVPDGLTVDAEGFVWSAWFDGARLERYDPDGHLERSVELPVSRPTSLTFGGPELTTVYITSASFGLSEAELRAQPLAGALLKANLGVAGCRENRFGG